MVDIGTCHLLNIVYIFEPILFRNFRLVANFVSWKIQSVVPRKFFYPFIYVPGLILYPINYKLQFISEFRWLKQKWLKTKIDYNILHNFIHFYISADWDRGPKNFTFLRSGPSMEEGVQACPSPLLGKKYLTFHTFLCKKLDFASNPGTATGAVMRCRRKKLESFPRLGWMRGGQRDKV